MTNALTEAGAITQPDHVGDYINTFRAGQTLAAPTPSPLDQATNALSGRLAVGSEAQRTGALRRAEILTALGSGLSAVPYPQRASILAHLAPALEKEGIPAAAVTGFDPTDDAVAAAIDQALAASRLLGAG